GQAHRPGVVLLPVGIKRRSISPHQVIQRGPVDGRVRPHAVRAGSAYQEYSYPVQVVVGVSADVFLYLRAVVQVVVVAGGQIDASLAGVCVDGFHDRIASASSRYVSPASPSAPSISRSMTDCLERRTPASLLSMESR